MWRHLLEFFLLPYSRNKIVPSNQIVLCDVRGWDCEHSFKFHSANDVFFVAGFYVIKSIICLLSLAIIPFPSAWLDDRTSKVLGLFAYSFHAFIRTFLLSQLLERWQIFISLHYYIWMPLEVLGLFRHCLVNVLFDVMPFHFFFV